MLSVRDESKILAALDRCAAGDDPLAPVCSLQAKLRRAQWLGQAEVKRTEWGPASARPLPFEHLAVEPAVLTKAALAVAAVISREVADAPEGDVGTVSEAEWLAEARLWYDGRGPAAGAPGATLPRLAVGHALVPWLERAALALPPVDESWARGYCPVCGGYPDLALLAPEYGGRRLVCCRCSTDWPYRRLDCPYCAGSDQRFGRYHPGFATGDRLYVCDHCRAYIKTVDLRERMTPIVVAVERVRLVPLDLAATAAGYRPAYT